MRVVTTRKLDLTEQTWAFAVLSQQRKDNKGSEGLDQGCAMFARVRAPHRSPNLKIGRYPIIKITVTLSLMFRVIKLIITINWTPFIWDFSVRSVTAVTNIYFVVLFASVCLQVCSSVRVRECIRKIPKLDCYSTKRQYEPNGT